MTGRTSRNGPLIYEVHGVIDKLSVAAAATAAATYDGQRANDGAPIVNPPHPFLKRCGKYHCAVYRLEISVMWDDVTSTNSHLLVASRNTVCVERSSCARVQNNLNQNYDRTSHRQTDRQTDSQLKFVQVRTSLEHAMCSSDSAGRPAGACQLKIDASNFRCFANYCSETSQ